MRLGTLAALVTVSATNSQSYTHTHYPLGATTMQIKDLETSHAMARDELSAVRGGFNVGSVGGQ